MSCRCINSFSFRYKEITEFIQDEAGYDTDLIWGNCVDESLDDKICVTVIATGFENKRSMEEVVQQRKDPVVVSLEDEHQNAKERGIYDTGFSEGEYKKSVDLDLGVPSNNYKPQTTSHSDPYVRHEPTAAPGPEQRNVRKAHEIKEEFRARNKKLNNPQAVIDLENEPAYLRRKVELDDVPHSSEITISRWTISGEDEPEIRRDNPYLHDNVD